MMSRNDLNEFPQIYTDTDRGLIAIAESVGAILLPPRKKVTVMLIGNRSVGKSSFINWYVEEQILSKTQGFTFVTSGHKRASLTSKETFQLFPQFQPLQEVKGVSKYVGTEICTSRKKCFSLVTFVDTPGLVDGDMKYPFDVDRAVLQLGDVCDLILVFFDPMGQALSKHTLNIVEQLYKRHGHQLRFYLSKADEVARESDRQRLLVQIEQELCKRPGLNKCGFDMPTIYIPNPNKPCQCVNQIEEVCRTIEKTINETVLNTQDTLDKDCDLILEAITDTLNNDGQDKWKSRYMSYVLGLMGVGVLLFFMLMMAFVYGEVMDVAQDIYVIEILLLYLIPFMRVFDSVPLQLQLIACGFLMQLSVILHILAFLLFLKPTLTEKEKRQLWEKLEYVQQVANTKKEPPPLSGFEGPPTPPPLPPTPWPPGGDLALLRSPPGLVRSRKFQTEIKRQIQTTIQVERTVFEELDDECLLQVPKRGQLTALKKKDTALPKSTMIPKMPESDLRKNQLKRQLSEGANQEMAMQADQENEMRNKQEMVAKDQSTLQEVPQKDLIPEMKKKDTTLPKMDGKPEPKKRHLKRQVTQ